MMEYSNLIYKKDKIPTDKAYISSKMLSRNSDSYENERNKKSLPSLSTTLSQKNNLT